MNHTLKNEEKNSRTNEVKQTEAAESIIITRYAMQTTVGAFGARVNDSHYEMLGLVKQTENILQVWRKKAKFHGVIHY